MKLEDIGFYTLSDERVKNTNSKNPLHRCELILTDACNFKCPYCRGQKADYAGTLSRDMALRVLDYWISEGIINVGFTGGEPTLYKHLCEIVKHCKDAGLKRMALSTNGSAPREKYEALLDAGMNDFSMSLDACCPETGDVMTGVKGQWQNVVDNIKFLASKSYVTVNIVVTEENVGEAVKVIELASSLGVADMRIATSAQWNQVINLDVNRDILNKHPILRYKINEINSGNKPRGLCESDSNRCALVLDDMAVVRDNHFPCVVYFRERGNPIGKIGPSCRADREKWFLEHDTHCDPICKANCLNIWSFYNNKYREFHK